MASESHVVLVPMKVDAFVLNDQTCKGSSKLAAIQRPDYKALRAESEFIEPDVLQPVDIFNSTVENPRLYNAGTGEKLPQRPGVYLHWVMPQCYRHAVTATEEAMPQHNMQKLRTGYFGEKTTLTDPEEPEDQSLKLSFRACPNRFLVVRCMKITYYKADKSEIEMYVAGCYAVSSDRIRFLGSIPFDEDLDIESSPFLDPHAPLERQPEVYLGLKQRIEEWTEDEYALRHTPLNVVDCSNPYFADYQPQNAGVFSIHDDMSYDDGTTVWKDWKTATAIYCVFGWHTDLEMDPFHLHELTATADPSTNTMPPTNRERLVDCFMELIGGDAAETTYKSWLDAPVSGRTLCHGTVYGVTAFREGTRTGGTRVDQLQDSINNQHPIAVGGTGLDALFAWLEVQQAEDPTTSPVVKEILALQALLLSREENPDGQAAAEEQLSFDHFNGEEGETHYHFSAADNSDTIEIYMPSDDIQAKLEELNDMQRLYDAAVREVQTMRWELFSEWWKAVTFKPNIKETDDSITTRKNNIKARVAEITTDLTSHVYGDTSQGSLIDLLGRLQASLVALGAEQELIEAKVDIKTGAGDRYYLPKDPTVLVGGVPSGWPSNFDDPLPVRLDPQISERGAATPAPVSPTPAQQDSILFFGSYDDCFNKTIAKMPTKLQDTARTLLTREFPSLQMVASALGMNYTYPPAYFLNGDRWYEQPLCPLFVEWEVEYHHIDFENWEFVMGDDNTYRYSLKKDKAVSSLPSNTTIISGRSMVSAEAQLSLQKAVKELLDTTPETTAPEILEKYRSEEEEKKLLASLAQIEYFCCKLDGFREQLITRMQETHIKPNFLVDGQMVDESVVKNLLDDFGIGKSEMERMDIASETTPFASLKSIQIAPTQAPGDVPCPFKPVTHGQFRFTKMNIVDKFGQVLTAPVPLHPCTSVEYSLNTLADNVNPNSVDGAPATVENECVQVPPSINQPARWNSEFMTFDKQGFWRPTTEYENPIWGWLMVDYTDKSIQVFQPDGQFYIEIGLHSGGKDKITIRANLPEFAVVEPSAGITPVAGGGTKANTEAIATGTTQLDAFLRLLLPSPEEPMPALPFAIFSTMSKAMEDGALAVPQNNLTDSLPVTMGRPIALVNSGWCLELSSPPYENESTIVPGAPPAGKQLFDYSFPLKLGDGYNRRDGFIGYFKAPPAPPTPPADVAGEEPAKSNPFDAFDYKTLFTYFLEDDLPTGTDPRVAMGAANLPSFRPFYAHPTNYSAPEQYHRDRNAQFQVFPTLLDPFAPVYGYSGILPIAPLSLPAWSVERAMRNLTASIRVGPTLLPIDLPAFRLDHVPTSLADIEGAARGGAQDGRPAADALPVPAAANGQWAWMQPYPISGGDGGGSSGGLDVMYNAYGICPSDVVPRMDERALLCVVEGYLELTKPMSA